MAQWVKIITEETVRRERKEKQKKSKLMMLCPICGSETKVYLKKNFLDKNGYIRRYRECKSCGHKFVTIQNYSREIIVEKRSYGQNWKVWTYFKGN